MQIYLPIAELPVDVFFIVLMGMAVGFISGMFGIGGGFLLTPLLIFVGIPPAVAVATQAPQIVATSTTGAIAYWRKRAVDFKLGMVLLTGGLTGTFLGVAFFNQMRRIGQLDTVISLSYLTLLGLVGSFVLIESLNAIIAARRGRAKPTRRGGQHSWYEGLPFKMRFPRSGLYISVIPVLIVSLAIGFAGAVLGIGGGFILVPALIYIFRVRTAVVVGTSLFQILLTMIAATLLHAISSHTVDIYLALLLMGGSVFGAQFGARTGAAIKAEHFRFLLGALVLIVAVRFGVELMGQPKEMFSVTATETVR